MGKLRKDTKACNIARSIWRLEGRCEYCDSTPDKVQLQAIGDYENYIISSCGKVYSFTQKSKGKMLKPRIKKKGYLHVALYSGLGATSFTVHRLVGKAFIPNPNKKPQINHKDGDKTNNHVENLEWVDNRANAIHAFANNLRKSPRGDNHGMVKYKTNTVTEILRRKQQGESGGKISKDMGIAKSTVYYAINKRGEICQ